MNNRPNPSIISIIKADYLAFLGIIFPVVALIMYLALEVFGFFPGIGRREAIEGKENAPFFLYFLIGALVIGIPLVIWRLRSAQQMFAKGIEVVGNVTEVYFHRDRGSIEYTYTYQGETYTGGNAVMKTGRTTRYLQGDQVILLVNPDKPERALIRDLYV